MASLHKCLQWHPHVQWHHLNKFFAAQRPVLVVSWQQMYVAGGSIHPWIQHLLWEMCNVWAREKTKPIVIFMTYI